MWETAWLSPQPWLDVEGWNQAWEAAGGMAGAAQEQPISGPGAWLCPGLGSAIPNSKRGSWEPLGADGCRRGAGMGSELMGSLQELSPVGMKALG